MYSKFSIDKSLEMLTINSYTVLILYSCLSSEQENNNKFICSVERPEFPFFDKNFKIGLERFTTSI